MTDNKIEKEAALAEAVEDHGFDSRDFEVNEDFAPELSQWGLPEPIVVVRRRSTGDERLYLGASCSAWLGCVLADLTLGHFGYP